MVCACRVRPQPPPPPSPTFHISRCPTGGLTGQVVLPRDGDTDSSLARSWSATIRVPVAVGQGRYQATGNFSGQLLPLPPLAVPPRALPQGVSRYLRSYCAALGLLQRCSSGGSLHHDRTHCLDGGAGLWMYCVLRRRDLTSPTVERSKFHAEAPRPAQKQSG